MKDDNVTSHIDQDQILLRRLAPPKSRRPRGVAAARALVALLNRIQDAYCCGRATGCLTPSGGADRFRAHPVFVSA
jgi:hypothetical protein